MVPANPDKVAVNVFWSVIVCVGGFALAVLLTVY